MSIFDRRLNVKPYEYPQLIKYAKAIPATQWVVEQHNFTQDIKQFHTSLNTSEKKAIERTMMAISQIEIQVKTFWGKLYDRLPKPEVAAVGFTFAESEVRHMFAYSHLLELLGLNEEFENIVEVPQIQRRIAYLDKYIEGTRSESNEGFTKSIILFSMFTEHVSLFSQFLIMLSFQKKKNLLKAVGNVVDDTMHEENLHGFFGAHIVKIIKSEFPTWFDSRVNGMIESACRKAFEAEVGLLDWIFEYGELDFLPKKVIIEFLKDRFNQVLMNGDFKPIFDIDDDLLQDVEWFRVKLKATADVDFFDKNANTYSKKTKSITENDLF